MPVRLPLRTLPIVVALLVSLGPTTACGDAATTPLTPDDVAGIYTLAAVSGRGPATGTFVLSAEGAATRSVRYPASGSAVESVMTGAYTLDGVGGILFTLSESAISSYMWPVRGEWRGSSFSISYPDPADGPDIVETYRRMP